MRTVVLVRHEQGLLGAVCRMRVGGTRSVMSSGLARSEPAWPVALEWQG